MIASLGMYDRAECQPANDRLWALIRDGLRAAGIDAPERLTRGEGAYWPAWQSPDLILSQTCGYPFRARLHGQVRLVGTPDYGVEGCPPGHYRSVLVARAGDGRGDVAEFDGVPLAYNEALSQSGWAAPQTHAARIGIRLPAGPATGAHRASAETVAEGRADIAALDAVTWGLIQRFDPALAAVLKVVGRTDPTPGLPLITGPAQDADLIAGCVARAIDALSEDDRATLRLRGLVRLPAADYLAVPNPPAPDQFARSD